MILGLLFAHPFYLFPHLFPNLSHLASDQNFVHCLLIRLNESYYYIPKFATCLWTLIIIIIICIKLLRHFIHICLHKTFILSCLFPVFLLLVKIILSSLIRILHWFDGCPLGLLLIKYFFVWMVDITGVVLHTIWSHHFNFLILIVILYGFPTSLLISSILM